MPGTMHQSVEEQQEQQSIEMKPLRESSLHPAKDAPPLYLEGWRIYAVTIGLMLSCICSGLDRSIIAVATPAITSEFNSIQDVGWYGSAYLLTMCAFQLPMGKLFAELSIKYVYLATMLIFEVGSIICAVAPSSMVLIIGRAIAGIGGAGVVAGSLIVRVTFVEVYMSNFAKLTFQMVGRVISPERRPAFLGLLGATINVAQAFGPLIGGALVAVSWRWCFWINLPCGAVTVVILVPTLRTPPTEPRPRGESWFHSALLVLDKLDAQSAAILIPSIVCLLLALQWGGSTEPWNGWKCILLLCSFGILLLSWTYMQYRRGDRATVSLRIVRERSVAFGTLYSMAAFGSSMIMLYYLPIWFQAVRQVSALKAGVSLIPLMLSWAALVIVSAQITSRTGYLVPQMIASGVVMPIMTGLITQYNENTSQAYWVMTLFFYGCSIGLGVQQPILAAMAFLEGKDIALGTSLIMFFQVLSGTIMISVGQNVFSQRLKIILARSAPSVDLKVVLAAGNDRLGDKMARIYSPQLVRDILHAYNQSIVYVFRVALVLSCLTILGSLGMEWRNINKERIEKEASD